MSAPLHGENNHEPRGGHPGAWCPRRTPPHPAPDLDYRRGAGWGCRRSRLPRDDRGHHGQRKLSGLLVCGPCLDAAQQRPKPQYCKSRRLL